MAEYETWKCSKVCDQKPCYFTFQIGGDSWSGPPRYCPIIEDNTTNWEKIRILEKDINND